MTGSEAVVRAARQLAGATNETFHLNDLVVHAWRLCPERLGLKGYSDRHPDSNAVKQYLSKSSGQVYYAVERVGPNLYRLRTRQGARP